MKLVTQLDDRSPFYWDFCIDYIFPNKDRNIVELCTNDAQTKSQFPREIFGQLDHNLDIYAPHSPGTFPVRAFHFSSYLNFVAECISFTSTFTFAQISGDSLLPWDGLHNPCNRIFQHSHSFGKFPILINVICGCMRIMLNFIYDNMSSIFFE